LVDLGMRKSSGFLVRFSGESVLVQRREMVAGFVKKKNNRSAQPLPLIKEKFHTHGDASTVYS